MTNTFWFAMGVVGLVPIVLLLVGVLQWDN